MLQRSSSTPLDPRGRYRRLGGLATGALVLVLGLAACSALPGPAGSDSSRSGASSSVGRQYAGHVPWASAVIDSDDTTIHLLADWDHTDGFVCDTPDERLQLSETATNVSITIRAYARLLPDGVGCGGVGHLLQPHTVHLTRPLGARPLLDGGSHQRQPVLDDTSIPDSDTIPAGYTAQPLTWIDNSDTDRAAIRRWQKIAIGTRRLPVLLQLTVGLPTTGSGFDSPPPTTLNIHGAPASISRHTNAGQVFTTLNWTTRTGRQTTLTAIGTDDDHLRPAQVIAFARSLETRITTPTIRG